MKKLKIEEGGRPLENDDLELLQGELYYAITGQLYGLPACVVFGCEVQAVGGNRYNVGAGLVFINGEIARFAGISGTTLPGELYLGEAFDDDLRPYETGGSKYCTTEMSILFRTGTGGTGSKVVVQPAGVLTAEKVREARTRSVGEAQLLTAWNPEDYDGSGRGKYGTKCFGWALLNGNNGTANPAGRFPVFHDPAAEDYNAVGKTGGAAQVTLTTEQMPAHKHSIDEGGEHTHTYSGFAKAETGENNRSHPRASDRTTQTTSSSGRHGHNMQNAGGGQAHENRPPWFVFAGRQWVGLQY